MTCRKNIESKTHVVIRKPEPAKTEVRNELLKHHLFN